MTVSPKGMPCLYAAPGAAYRDVACGSISLGDAVEVVLPIICNRAEKGGGRGMAVDDVPCSFLQSMSACLPQYWLLHSPEADHPHPFPTLARTEQPPQEAGQRARTQAPAASSAHRTHGRLCYRACALVRAAVVQEASGDGRLCSGVWSASLCTAFRLNSNLPRW
eukprot:CAMPEP_0206252784 /NCGR_PEP_ID=MMETSP0047_2-20121206/22795_1 /ASSEMBLY_ACC=CAM_ASM_000192 /TAXON_ID=195065 /ORGANISM="Chroomonas mesostigmatica_cf, Strain CCMP1168" /LENGTH=164 /DNA_ID=CAMNT_0053678933 /DNA_START=42 /DNA_END=534 /DNA_ORIENTATION=-